MIRVLAIAVIGVLGAGVGAAEAAFPGHNGKLVYVAGSPASVDGMGTALVVREPGGAGRTVLRRSEGDKPCVGNPAFSPDGALLALETCEGLATVRADGSEFRQLPLLSDPGDDPFSYARDGYPTWTPSDERLLFVSETAYDDGFQSEAFGGLATVNSDGTGLRRLTDELVTGPQWSSRGLIAFASRPHRGDPAIYVIRPSGRGERLLARRGEQPAWSPDGRRIAFASGPRGDAPYRGQGPIDIVRADGSGRRALVRGFCPAWSPNGKRLAFIQQRHGRRGKPYWAIYTIRTDGTDRRLVTRSRRELGGLDWQPVHEPF